MIFSERIYSRIYSSFSVKTLPDDDSVVGSRTSKRIDKENATVGSKTMQRKMPNRGKICVAKMPNRGKIPNVANSSNMLS